MKCHWNALISLTLAVFTTLIIAWQCLHSDRDAMLRDYIEHGRTDGRDNELVSSVAQSFIRIKQLAVISDIVKRDELTIPAAGLCRYIDLALPKDARVYMPDMTGATNYSRVYYYYYVAYYLFPRDVGVSMDQPARLDKWGFVGRPAESDQEILTNGYDAIVAFPPDGTLTLRLLRPQRELPVKEPVTPDWFSSNSDTVAAFLLPLLTALSGMWLFRFLFPTLNRQMPSGEQLACGLGLGMMAVAAITLGVKLCGLHGRGLVFIVTALGGIAELWRHGRAYWTVMKNDFWKLVSNPVVATCTVAGFLVFLILFRLAGLEGLIDDDALRWMPKAKILHLYTGNVIVQWFSNPRLAHAHLDYPTLVPSLQAATFDSIGHVNEFVTKFWPVWMLFFLLAGLASLNQGGNRCFQTPHLALLGLLLLPATQKYAQMEGGTLPMIFFTVLGFNQCAAWLMGKDRARLGLGLTLLFGAAMTKFEGFIFLALAGSWMLMLPSARPALEWSPRVWRVFLFCLLAALPFICLRSQIPSLHYESGWARYALHHPDITFLNWPGIFLIMIARLFLNPAFAHWNGDDGRFHWAGRWDGFSSLYDQATLGLAWFCLLMTVALWLALPSRRRVILWALAMFIGATLALSGVFASFTTIKGLNEAVDFTGELTGGRYLLPVLVAWFTTLMMIFFTQRISSTSTPDPSTEVPCLPSPVNSSRNPEDAPKASKE